MEHSSNSRIISIIIILAAVVGLGYVFASKKPLPALNNSNLSLVVTVENTPMVSGVLPLPPGFPEEIPHEHDKILESSTTFHPTDGTTQLSLSYMSPKNYIEKHYEYENYMRDAGYSIETDSSIAGATSLHGERGEEELFVNIKSSGQGSVVEVSYLFK